LQYNKVYFLVHQVEGHSPAEAGDLRANDIIHSVNDKLTEKMPHSTFVDIVHSSSRVKFIVQDLNNYLKVHPAVVRTPMNKSTVPTVAPTDNIDKYKAGLSKAFNKISGNR
jgi:C-terminal processing protease CtpA/Prc